MVAVDIDSNSLIEQGFSSNVLLKTIDLTSNFQIKKFIQDILFKYGGVDILVSNAGFAPQSSILEMEEDV